MTQQECFDRMFREEDAHDLAYHIGWYGLVCDAFINEKYWRSIVWC